MIALMTDWHIGIHKMFSILKLDKYSELNGFLMALCVLNVCQLSLIVQ